MEKKSLLIIFFVSIIASLLVYKPFFTPDESTYVFAGDKTAKGIGLQNIDVRQDRVVHMLVFSFFIKLFGLNLLVLKAYAVLMAAVGAVLLYLLAKELKLSEEKALFAGLFYATAPNVLNLASSMLTEVPAMTLAIASLLLLLKGIKSRSFLRSILAGLLAAIALLNREVSATVLIGFIAAIVLFKRKELQWKHFGAFALTGAIVLGAWYALTGFDPLWSYRITATYSAWINWSPMLLVATIVAGSLGLILLAVLALRKEFEEKKFLYTALVVTALFLFITPRIEVRYTLIMLPALALVSANAFEKIAGKTRLIAFAIILLNVAGGIALNSYWHTLNSMKGYQEAGEFAFGKGVVVTSLCRNYYALFPQYQNKLYCLSEKNSLFKENGLYYSMLFVFNKNDLGKIKEKVMLIEHSNHLEYASILSECKKILVEEFNRSLFTVKHSIKVYEVSC